MSPKEKLQEETSIRAYVLVEEFLQTRSVGEILKKTAERIGVTSFIASLISQLVETIDRLVGGPTLVTDPLSPHERLPFPLKNMIEKLANFGFLERVVASPTFHDAPRFFHFESFNNIEGKTDGSKVTLWGIGVAREPVPALEKAIAELTERSVFAIYRRQDIFYSTWRKLGKAALNPSELTYFTPKQLLQPHFKNYQVSQDSVFGWQLGTDFLSGKKLWLPAQLLYWNYRVSNDEPRIFDPITNGEAVGTSFEHALLSGFYEVIERDALMLYWLRKIPPQRVDLAAAVSTYPELGEVLEPFERYSLQLDLCYLPTEFETPVFVAVIRDFSQKGPAVVIGAGCHINTPRAIEKAILEATSVYHITRKLMVMGQSKTPSPNAPAFRTPLTQEERLLFWSQPEMGSKIDWFISGEKLTLDFPRREQVDNKDELRRLRILLERLNMKCFYFDATPQKLKKQGLWAVKTIVPEAIPLYLDEIHPYLGVPRLYQDYGGGSPPGTWNSVPHPLS